MVIRDLMDQVVALKINALVAAGITLGTSALAVGGKIAVDNARAEQVQVELKQARQEILDTRQGINELRGEFSSRFVELERSVMRTEEQGRVQIKLLDQILSKK